MNEITPRQLAILEWIKVFIREHGYPPTRAEIAKGFGWKSANSAQDHLYALEDKGYIELDKRVSRGIRVL